MVPIIENANPYFVGVFLLGLAGSPILIWMTLDSRHQEDVSLAQLLPAIIAYLLATGLALALATTESGGGTDALLPHVLLLLSAVFFAALMYMAWTMDRDQRVRVEDIVEEEL